jgi:hypothetical protein
MSWLSQAFLTHSLVEHVIPLAAKRSHSHASYARSRHRQYRPYKPTLISFSHPLKDAPSCP